MRDFSDINDAVFKTAMRRSDRSSHKAHLPVYIASLVLGAAFGTGLYFIRMSGWEHGLTIALVILTLLIAAQIPVLIIALRLSAKEAFLFPDKLVLKMWLGRKTIPLKDIIELKQLSPGDVKKSFFRLSAINLNLCTINAVMIRRSSGRPYIISPEDCEEFIAAYSRVAANAPDAEDQSKD